MGVQSTLSAEIRSYVMRSDQPRTFNLMLETPKTYAECSLDEREFIHQSYGGPLPDSAVVHIDRGHLCIEQLNLAEVAAMDRFANLEIEID